MIAIQLNNLSKTYGKGAEAVQAVNNLTLEIEAGQVYGFLGPNGAGKTTTIQMMLDLIRPIQGEALLFGQEVRSQRDVLKRVGALVEGATFYNFLSGRENLKVIARTADITNPSRIEELLELVGLSGRADRDVKGYSTGMKQRLGLAAALLNDPDLLILDEPSNGLDPAGIQEIRELVRSMADQRGKTVFLSSHILSEVEQICDRVAIVRRGELVREGPIAELLGSSVKLRIETSQPEQAAQHLSERWQVTRDGDWLAVDANREDAPHLLRYLLEKNIDVYQVSVARQSLESYFMDATGEETHHEVS